MLCYGLERRLRTFLTGKNQQSNKLYEHDVNHS